jgi:hypothetical protein
MRESLFLWIVDKVTEADSYFKQKRNCAGQRGFSPIHKCTIAIKMLAYGSIADSLDDHLQMGESTVLETLKRFVRTIVNVFGKEWIRPPSEHELQEILKVNEARGFPGMAGSMDCMHWEWTGCPTALHGMYKGHKGKPTMILEAVVTEDLRFWHAYFGLPGSHNDINVLHRSPVFDDLANGRAPSVEFTVNGNIYNMCYYLADGIYPDWATLVKTISAPISNKHKVYAERQEACRKDVERGFGVLQARWKIIHSPARLWHQEDLNYIMRACIILHNMIIMDEKGVDLPTIHLSEWPGRENPPVCNIADFIDAQTYIRNKETCHHLRTDLVEHIWGLYGSGTGPFARKASM